METGALVPAALVIVAAFFIGGIPFGVVVARLVGGPDPRTLGSGRTGGANVLRAIGPGPALAAGLLDMLKGTVAVLIARWVGAGPWVEVLAGCAAIIGHSRSPYLRLGGGRGVSVAFGTLLVLEPIVAGVTAAAFAAIVVVSGYSSLGSLLGAAGAGLAYLVIQLTNGGPAAYACYAVAAPTLIWLFHIDNIQRLLGGTERKLDWRRRGSGPPPAAPPTASPPAAPPLAAPPGAPPPAAPPLPSGPSPGSE